MIARSLPTLSVLFLLASGEARAQAVKDVPPPDSPLPPLTYRGLVPGRSTAEEVRQVLGEPLTENRWYSYKLLYPARGRPGYLDAVHLRGRNGTLGNIEAASIPEGYEKLEKILARLGEPEFEVRLQTQRILEYSTAGLRFTLRADGRTIGVAYFPHGRRRVHAGATQHLDVSGLPRKPIGEKPVRPRGLRVGSSRVRLTPKEQHWLGPKRFVVHDDLWARIAVLAQGEHRIAIVGADLFGMSLSEVEPIARRLEAVGTDITTLLLAQSHNHAAPDTIGIYGFFPEQHVAYIQDQVVLGVRQAVENMQNVAEVRGAQVELALDGARVHRLVRNARNPGLLDPRLSTLRFLDADGQTLVTLVHLACHPEGLEAGTAEISADFPGYLADEVDRRLGGRTIFLNGALGGMVSGDTNARSHAECERMGRDLAKRVIAMAAEDHPATRDRLRVQKRRLEIPLTNARFRAFMELTKRRQLVRGRVVTEMALIEIGDAELLTVPGELLPELGLEIQAHMRGFPSLIVGLANDQLGYILPAYDFRDDAYEESMSVGPAAGPLVKELAKELLEAARTEED